MSTLIQFGAGNIGRSFIGERFSNAGYEVVFIDVDARLVDALNEIGSYRVIIKHNEKKDQQIKVKGVRAVDGRDIDAVREEFLNADYVATSVGMSAFPRIAPVIAAGVRARAELEKPPIDIILAENIRNSSDQMRSHLEGSLASDPPEVKEYLNTSVGLVETSIGKMVPIMTDEDRALDPLWVFAEAYNTLIVDKAAFRGPLPAIEMLKPVDSIAAYVDRKLFVHNLGHAAAAYLGYQRHPESEFLYEVLEDDSIRLSVRQAMQQSADALHAAYTKALRREELSDHIDDLLYRFSNRSLRDTVFRVGRDIPRKLGRDDRVIGAALLAATHGLPLDRIAGVAAAAMRFRATDEHGALFATDAQFVRQFAGDVDKILSSVCELSSSNTEEDRIVIDSVKAAHEATM